jgi:glycosyltransferase involved in cell wall biosynthesis
MPISLGFDNIIYNLQKDGGASLYWREITARVLCDPMFDVKFIDGSKTTRFLPIFSNFDILHSSHFRTSFSNKTKVVSTIHDLIYEKGMVSTSKLGNTINNWQRKQAVECADVLICISENTKKEMLEVYPTAANTPIYVISHGCSFDRSQIIPLQTTKRLLELEEKLKKFVLYVGTRNSYKNFNAALVGFATSSLIHDGFSLVCTGKNFNESEVDLIHKLGATGKVLVINNATHAELGYLYQNSFALVYPSTYEGFGLPPLEAMGSGSPVIASNSSSIPEVVGEAGILLDEIENPDTIRNALESLLDNQVRKSYIAKGFERAELFTWDKSASQHIQAYRSLL